MATGAAGAGAIGATGTGATTGGTAASIIGLQIITAAAAEVNAARL
jgi:hypothetical protein